VTNFTNFTRKAWRVLNQDKLQLFKYDAVMKPFHLPDLSPLANVMGGSPTSMFGHALFMYNLAWQMNAQTIVEIGVGPGDSTSIFLLALRETGGKLVSIDIERQPGAEARVDALGMRSQWEFIQKPSQDVGRAWDPTRKIDILLIDGLHTYNQIALEMRLFRPHMNRSGYILFHDSHNIRGVRKFIGRIRWRYGGVQFPWSNGLYVIRMS
jgi:predicted O-methyltransferase YrrM